MREGTRLLLQVMHRTSWGIHASMDELIYGRDAKRDRRTGKGIGP